MSGKLFNETHAKKKRMNINYEYVMAGPISSRLELPEGDVTEDNPAQRTTPRGQGNSIIIIARPS